MLRIPVEKIKSGMILARSVPLPSDPRRFLLQRDQPIPLSARPRLKKLGIHEVWIRHSDLEFMEDLFDEGLEEKQREVYRHVRSNFEAIMRDSSASLDLAHFEESVGESSVNWDVRQHVTEDHGHGRDEKRLHYIVLLPDGVRAQNDV